jgi:hypothetical protein
MTSDVTCHLVAFRELHHGNVTGQTAYTEVGQQPKYYCVSSTFWQSWAIIEKLNGKYLVEASEGPNYWHVKLYTY